MELPYRDPDEIELEQRLRGYALRSLRFTYEETNRLIDLQMDQVESLNTKASILLGFIGVIVAALFSAWPVMAEQPYEHNGRLIKSKIRSLKWCLGFLLFSFLILTVVFLWSIIN